MAMAPADHTCTELRTGHASASSGTHGRTVAADPRPLTNVLVMGVGYFFVMGGYMPVQSFASSLLNFDCIAMGDISIGIVYLTGSIGALLGPAVVERVGAGRTMLISSLAFPIFAASVSYVVLPVVLATSFMLGFFGAWINIAQGVCLSACTTPETHGLYSGILQAFNQGASLPGNIIAVWLIPTSDASAPPRKCGNTTATLLVPGWDDFDSPLFLGCACCCLVGSLLLLLYRSPPPVVGAPPPPPPPTALESLQRIWAVCTHRAGIRLLLPFMLYTGVSIGFWSGMFTRQMPSGLVGPAMCILGGGEVVGGLLVGEVVDRLGVRAACVFVVLVQGGALALAHFADEDQDKLKFWVAAGMLGVADNGVQTAAYAVLATRFQDGDDSVGAGARSIGGGEDAVNGSVQRDDAVASQADDASVPLLGPPAATRSATRFNGAHAFDTSDGFSALFLVQGIAVALLFFLLPVCSGTSERSSKQQFLWEEAVVFGLLLLGMGCLAADDTFRHAR